MELPGHSVCISSFDMKIKSNHLIWYEAKTFSKEVASGVFLLYILPQRVSIQRQRQLQIFRLPTITRILVLVTFPKPLAPPFLLFYPSPTSLPVPNEVHLPFGRAVLFLSHFFELEQHLSTVLLIFFLLLLLITYSSEGNDSCLFLLWCPFLA